ncbi:phosphatidylserine decarboxylase precursor [Aquimarina sp. MAR_2010_214]|uniref:phosphatidylserine decarboxylase n=1 Tax=Aquimarina sp. MAR_2010_214 TaxID=1250026 RepID=UPI000C710A80|nr:phosphatidylserine decarboxylase [Aquimarina sp. MAR_2010_214]PKV49151.1 phosphatidylserine decarboxylase precursor [Aquimarina sp. MAR_2010_214]
MDNLTVSLESSKVRIEFLNEKCKIDNDFLSLLIESLEKAKSKAEKNLNENLYNALEWPTNVEDYVAYLRFFSRWAPRQSGEEAWKNPEDGQSQEVYDRLCHFYWLIDQKVGKGETTIVENIPWFSQWLVDYAKDWGSFLNTTDSFDDEILESFIKYSPKYRVEDSMVKGKPNNPSGWLTFNQFFARELNPGLRPIENPEDNTVIACPADCTYKQTYAIDADSNIPKIKMKKTHEYASIQKLLEGSQYKDAFANGTFVHYFLGPYSYHRFHTPVAGFIRECYPVQGLVYLDVHINQNQFNAPDQSRGGYEFTQARGVVTIDTTNSDYGNVGIVAVIPIGMCQVSSVNMIATPNRQCLKGDEFGYFLFGGSDIIVLFQEGVNPEINTSLDYRHYGREMAKGRILD